jgi:DUF438 domain-containing protein
VKGVLDLSEIINNREYRKEVLKEILLELHQGKDVDEVKEKFQSLIKDIGSTELAEIEQSLVNEGLPPEEIKKLCDVHVSIFKDALNENPVIETKVGHPVSIFKSENRAIEKVVEDIKVTLAKIKDDGDINFIGLWKENHEQLMELEKHYSRKENLVFPYIEKNGITGPPSVMWSVHDDIRAELKKVKAFLESGIYSPKETKEIIDNIALPLLNQVTEMIYKEENILFPMCLEVLTEGEWKEIYDQSDDIGYTLITPKKEWNPEEVKITDTEKVGIAPEGYLKFDTGILKLEEISGIFNSLPFDITFVDKDDTVKYFSHGDRIFERTKAIIGRKVQNCHPPESVHVVNQIVADFKEGKRETADFWINFMGKFVHIRYFPVRNETGEFLGTLEVTQDLTKIKELTGEKRLLDEE